MHTRLFAMLAFCVICLMGRAIDLCKAPAGQAHKPIESAQKNSENPPAGDAKTENDAATTVVKRVRELHGSVEFDANGKPIGIDLLDRQASDRDVKTFTLLRGIQKLSLWGQNHR